MFEKELDRYESVLAARQSATAAREARREMAAHLEADLAARLELGASEADARAGAIAALGDLTRAARAETPRWSRLGAESALLIAPVLLTMEWFLPQIPSLATHGIPVLGAVTAVLLAAGAARRPRHPWIWGVAGGGSLALVATLGLVMADTWRKTGQFGLGHLSHGSWWDVWVSVPMFGLPPLVLYRVACALTDRSRAAFAARWVRRA